MSKNPKRFTLDDYWNTEEFHERSYDMQLKYVLNDWGYAEKQLNKQWLIKLANEQFKVLLLRRLMHKLLYQQPENLIWLPIAMTMTELDLDDPDKGVSG